MQNKLLNNGYHDELIYIYIYHRIGSTITVYTHECGKHDLCSFCLCKSWS